jgi:hypothetical protein
MRREIYEMIQMNPELKRYLREQPIWYRTLARHPEKLEHMQIEMMNRYRKTIPHKVSELSQSLQLISMMLGMMGLTAKQGE